MCSLCALFSLASADAQAEEPPLVVDPADPPPAVKPAKRAHVAPARVKRRPRPAAAAGDRWYEKLKMSAFVDAYYSFNFMVPDNSTNQPPRFFDTANGFSLSWFGADLVYEPGGFFGPVGATINLRGGPSGPILAGADAPLGLSALQQAYITFKFSEKLSIDMGKFNTIYGVEAPESQYNHSYTRGALFVIGPFFHTGLRVNVALSEQLSLKVLAVNGWNNSVDNNRMKTFGFQLAYTADNITAKIGYLLGPERAGIDDELRHFIDLAVNLKSGPLDFLFNADLFMEDFGGDHSKALLLSVSARYLFTDVWGAALRFEFVGDFDGLTTGTPDQNLITVTLTVDARINEYALIRLDNRIDAVTEGKPFRVDDTPNDSAVQITSTIGVVFMTN